MNNVHPLNFGNLSILPKTDDKYSYKELVDLYDDKEFNSSGVRRLNRTETSYLLRSFKELKISKNLENYYYKFVTEIVLIIDTFGIGRYTDAVIDDPNEIAEFLKGEPALGYDRDGEEVEVFRGQGNLTDWSEEYSVFFLARKI